MSATNYVISIACKARIAPKVIARAARHRYCSLNVPQNSSNAESKSLPIYCYGGLPAQKNQQLTIPYELFFEDAPPSAMKHLARLKADYLGEIVPLESDVEYSEFAAGLRSYEFEPDFDLDKD